MLTMYLESMNGSFTATTSMSSCWRQIRRTSLPILPKPGKIAHCLVRETHKDCLQMTQCRRKLAHVDWVDPYSRYHNYFGTKQYNLIHKFSIKPFERTEETHHWFQCGSCPWFLTLGCKKTITSQTWACFMWTSITAYAHLPTAQPRDSYCSE
jgi:hypothetical protein